MYMDLKAIVLFKKKKKKNQEINSVNMQIRCRFTKLNLSVQKTLIKLPLNIIYG